MHWSSFKTTVCGKWILAGEHSVLKGVTAIALPRSDIGLTLSFDPSDCSDLSVEPTDSALLIRDLLESVFEPDRMSGRFFSLPKGKLKIESTIPVGAGLGSSAALCLALTRWLAKPLLLAETDLVSFASRLEDRFHGKSSGMDVAVVSAAEAVSYLPERGVLPLGIKNLPTFTFHDTGLRSTTRECVQKVEKFREVDPLGGIRMDEAMAVASGLALEGLILFDAGQAQQGRQLLKASMQKSQECFYFWDLVPGHARRMEQELLAQGALAVKVTGAGGGGMLVALWE